MIGDDKMIYLYLFAALSFGAVIGFVTACLLVSQRLNK